jgi:hypothetical protein
MAFINDDQVEEIARQLEYSCARRDRRRCGPSRKQVSSSLLIRAFVS